MQKSEVDIHNVDTTDLTQEDGAPSVRADVLADRSPTRLNIEVELLKGFRFKMVTETADHVTTRLAQTLIMVVIAAAVPGALTAGLLQLASAPGWLVAIAGVGVMIVVGVVCLRWISAQHRKSEESMRVEEQRPGS
ncbi:hypothetical protein ACNF49_07265 [Actinomadura sp. ATCC 39365]